MEIAWAASGSQKKEKSIMPKQQPFIWSVICLFLLSLTTVAHATESDYLIITAPSAELGTDTIQKGILRVLGEAQGRVLDVKEEESRAYIKRLGIDFVPYVIFSPKIVEHPKFFHLARSGMIAREDGEYIVPKEMILPAGIVLFNRHYRPKHLDLFITSHCSGGKTAMRQIEDYLSLHPDAFTITVHYITTFRDFGIDSKYGVEEIREDIRQIIIQKFYPDQFFEYQKRYRAGDGFEKAFQDLNIPLVDVVERQDVGVALLREDCELCTALGIDISPTFLFENQVLLDGLSAFRQFLTHLNQQLLTRNLAEAAASQGSVPVDVFYTPGCPHCQWLIDTHIPNLKQTFGTKVAFHLYDVSIPENRERQLEAQKAHGAFGNSVPEVFVGGKEFVGRDEIEEGLERTINVLIGKKRNS
jgi:glutaredoxin